MQESGCKRVNLEHLAQEIASLLADSQFGLWEEVSSENAVCKAVDALVSRAGYVDSTFGGNSSRRMVATALFDKGFPAIGLPGVTPSILKLIETGEISVRSKYNDLAPSQVSEVVANTNSWYMTPEDAEKVKQRLLPEKLLGNIRAKIEEGRYTLEEAANLLNRADWLDEDASDDTVRSADYYLTKLAAAALNGLLPVYWPGKSDRFKYGHLTAVREYVEEACWSDLNKWLADNEPQIIYTFPNPDAVQPPDVSAHKTTMRGVTKSEILACEWPLPKQKGVPPLEKILNEIPKWVETSCIKVGRRGKGRDGSHRWNPAQLACCLCTTTPHKQWAANKTVLTKFLQQHYPEYFEEWETKAANL